MIVAFADVPLWAAILVSVFIVLGAMLTLLGAIGLVRLSSFYDRIHAPTLGTSWGAAGILMASMILFSVAGDRPIFHEILVGLFVTITTPVTMMLLGRAALFRDRSEGTHGVPSMAFGPDLDEPPADAPPGA